MSKFLYFVCVVCCYSCQSASVTEYHIDEVDSIHISYYGNRLNEYVCIKDQELIDSLCNVIYNSTTKHVAHFYPNMEITLYGRSQIQVFGVSRKYIKGYFSGENTYNLEDILKRIYKSKSIKVHIGTMKEKSIESRGKVGHTVTVPLCPRLCSYEDAKEHDSLWR